MKFKQRQPFDKVKLNEKELIFAYESLEDLKHLLDAFSINVDVEELEEWLKQNLQKQKLRCADLVQKN